MDLEGPQAPKERKHRGTERLKGVPAASAAPFSFQPERVMARVIP